jgi:hypothetical protein
MEVLKLAVPDQLSAAEQIFGQQGAGIRQIPFP